MQALWRPHLTLRDEFLQSLDLLEDLLVSRLSRSDARDFPRQLTIVLRDILNSSDRESWSGPSLIWDLCSFFGDVNIDLELPRPSDVLWPSVPRAYLLHFKGIPFVSPGFIDEREYQTACAEKVYDMLRCLAGMEVKPLAEVFQARGRTVPTSIVVDQQTQRSATTMSLEGRIKVVEVATEQMQSRVEKMTKGLREMKESDLHQRNLALAKKVSEYQDQVQRSSPTKEH